MSGCNTMFYVINLIFKLYPPFNFRNLFRITIIRKKLNTHNLHSANGYGIY